MDYYDALALYKKNIKFVYYCVKRAKSLFFYEEDEDLESIAMVGLWKACTTYDPDKGYTFATYAFKVIMNEFRMYYRKHKKHYEYQTISLDEVLPGRKNNEEPNRATRGDLIEDGIDLADVVTAHDIYKELSPILKMYLEGRTQREIAEAVGISQSYVCRLLKAEKKKLIRKYLEEGVR